MDLAKIESRESKKDVLALYSGGASIELSFAYEDILSIRVCRDPAACDASHPDSGDQEGESLVLAGQPQRMGFRLEQKGGLLVMETDCLAVEVSLDPFELRGLDKAGREVFRSARPFVTVGKGRTTARFSLKPDEKVYGLGQDPMGNLNQRGYERRMWHQWGGHRRSGNGGIPFYISSGGCGVLLNSSYPSRFAIGEAEVAVPDRMGEIMAPAPWGWDEHSGEGDPDTAAILLDHDCMELFIICRKDVDSIIRGYYELTGFPPLLPRWAYGFIQCKNRYRSQAELMKTARELRKRGIPCDALVIDWLWFKEFGDLEWDERSWPDPEGMLRELSGMGFRVLSAQHPFISERSKWYGEYRDSGFLNEVPEGKRITYDHSNPAARDHWWSKVKRLYDQGLRGYWTDMGEIEEHFPGTRSHMGSRERVHNIYTLLWSKGLYEGQRRDAAERVFVLLRAPYAGVQRYGAVLWSGDIDATWQVLKEQVVIGQGVCLSGQAWWTTDIGGFLTGYDFTPELYVRWMEWGAFCPIFRTHGTRPDNEPWAYGPGVERLCREIIGLRYRLMPYIYSCAAMVTREGRPMMQAMCADFADDPKAAEQVYQYMFGPSILVAPVLDKGVRIREVYLPKGVWYDFYSGRKYKGPGFVSAAAPLGRIPLFIKGGSIIPMGDEYGYEGQRAENELKVHIYPGADAAFDLYDDDHLTYAYEKGESSLLRIEYTEHAAWKEDLSPAERPAGVRVIRLSPSGSLTHGAGDTYGRIWLIIHDSDRPIDAALADGSPATYGYDPERRLLAISLDGAGMQEGAEVCISFAGTGEAGEAVSWDKAKAVANNVPDDSAAAKDAKADGLEQDYISKLKEGIRLYADADMESRGEVSVSMLAELPDMGCSPACGAVELSAALKVPKEWAIEHTDRTIHELGTYQARIPHTEDRQACTVKGSGDRPGLAQLKWTVKPYGAALPLAAHGVIEVECRLKGTLLLKKDLPVEWGSGWATRWTLAGVFDNSGNDGLDRAAGPEEDTEQLEYEDKGSAIAWVRDRAAEFNCFGYVDLRRLGAYHAENELIHGIAYAKCRVWSPDEREAYMEAAAEQGIKIWVNRAEVFRSADVVLKSLLPEPVILRKGWNSLLVKVVVHNERPYSGREFGFNLRLADKSGNVMADLKYCP
ncbi:MAG TPA: glycoside hydrolase family 31 protein [Candidatus Atribacteria bacterium]|nr:glycoside hydrolase family 31 protein [Candidatus Atribacteria bacterium]